MKKMATRYPVGLFITIGFFIAASIGPWIAPYSPIEINLENEYQLPSQLFWLGTCDNGVDILSIVLHGARLAATVGICAVGLSLIIGTVLGILAGFHGGWIDHIITATADLVQSFPAIVLYVAIFAVIAQPGMTHIILALVANGWVLYARIARAQTLSLRERDFVLAARTLGTSSPKILFRHILPNLIGPLLVQGSAGLGAAILAESTLSFLGLGPSKSASWGMLLDQGSAVLLRFPHVALIAGSVISITVLGFNLTGDWLRDRMDPKQVM